jgi:hypothetical protein
MYWARLSLAGGILIAGACTPDPTYIQPPTAAEFDPQAGAESATLSFDLPVRPETEEEALERAELEAELGVPVPYVGLQDLDLSIEWSATNLNPDVEANIRLDVNGANEYFTYGPAAFVIDPDEDEEPPALMKGIPLTVPAGSTLSGVYREDQLYEAGIDLELITRGGLNPFEAIFKIHEDETEFLLDGAGPAVPLEAMASLVHFDVTLFANRHVVVEVAVRAKDYENVLHDELLAADPAELVVFAPSDFAPAPPPP